MSAAGAKGTVGAVGLGIMGGAIAKNLAAAGWRVVGYDIDSARTAEAKAAGVETVANAAAAHHTLPASSQHCSAPAPEAAKRTPPSAQPAGDHETFGVSAESGAGRVGGRRPAEYSHWSARPL